MPNYDFKKDGFDIFWSNGDELAYLDRESLSPRFPLCCRRHSTLTQ